MSGDTDQEDKTESPTDKKLEDARERGEVPMAPEMKHAAMFVAALVVLGVVIHRVEGDSRGFYTGSDQRRQFRIKGDSLIIGNDSTARRVLVRVR